MKIIAPQAWREDIALFKEKTDAFYAGELDKGAYKAFSGYYGSYAQRGGKANMLRLRMTAGRVTREKMEYTAKALRQYDVRRLHFTRVKPFSSTTFSPNRYTALWRALWMREL